MLEKIKEKIDRNANCKLTIEELKVLYEIDYSSNENLYIYTERRNAYSDFIKLFGKEFVARTKEEITEDTICYVGNLYIDNKLPTYNLRYVYGELGYNIYSIFLVNELNLEYIYNLENLEIVYGNALFDGVNADQTLDNLRKVYGRLYLESSSEYSLDELLPSFLCDNNSQVYINRKKVNLKKDKIQELKKCKH